MLTYVPPEQRPAPPTYERPWLLLLLAFVWLWPGVFSHDLWQDEISVYAVIRQAAGRCFGMCRRCICGFPCCF